MYIGLLGSQMNSNIILIVPIITKRHYKHEVVNSNTYSMVTNIRQCYLLLEFANEIVW